MTKLCWYCVEESVTISRIKILLVIYCKKLLEKPNQKPRLVSAAFQDPTGTLKRERVPLSSALYSTHPYVPVAIPQWAWSATQVPRSLPYSTVELSKCHQLEHFSICQCGGFENKTENRTFLYREQHSLTTLAFSTLDPMLLHIKAKFSWAAHRGLRDTMEPLM